MMIDRFNSGTFVEIGAWKGRSACYVGERIKETGKDIKYYVVDHFKGTKGEVHDFDVDVINGTLYETFLKNIDPLKDYINVLKGDSKDMYVFFPPKSIDLLFLDGSHYYKDVKRDIKLWLPKVKGVIAGHDYDNPEVKKAVDEMLKVKIWNNCVWYADK